ncbi:MAG: hypothetical protein ABL927_14350 [Bdellovibrionales bacterium]
MKLFLLLAVFVFFNQSAFSAGVCTGKKLADSQKNVRFFLKNLEPSKTPWSELRETFKNIRECMSIAEIYDFGEAIRTTFLKKWNNLPEPAGFKKSDPQFYQFVMSGLQDETAIIETINQISNKAKLECLRSQESICTDIKTLAIKSLEH